MQAEKYPLSPPSLDEIANALQPALQQNYREASVSVIECPDLRDAPFHLASEGLTGDEAIADVGGQDNLFPHPRLECKYNLLEIARVMGMRPDRGSLIGAGAGPFHVVGQNSEMVPNLSWRDGFENVDNQSRLIKIGKDSGEVCVDRCTNTECALMVNLFGSLGLPGLVLRITAVGRTGPQQSFSECIRQALLHAFGDARPVSLGGVFVVRSGKSQYHIMPDFPAEDFETRQDVTDWLTFHEFEAPMVCLSVLHSADPQGSLGLRMEHTHCFSADGRAAGGHYHGDAEDGADGGDVSFEAYFDTAKTLFCINKSDTC